VQHAADRISWKFGRQPSCRVASPLLHSRSALRCTLLQIGEPAPQTESIQLIDGKHSNAALRASRPAHQPLAASAGHIGERGVYDLD
jgi:hypothetical protein